MKTFSKELRRLARQFINETMQDIKVEGKDEFNRNFERQAFFNEKWARRGSYDTDTGRSILIKSGRLRKSITSRIDGNTIIYESTEPYAAIHNEGGTIAVTKRMKGYFWYLYREALGIILSRHGAEACRQPYNHSQTSIYRRASSIRAAHTHNCH